MTSSSIDASSRFLASTLHEIRTPIQTIIGTIELLGDTPLDKEQTEYVRQIEFSANVLLQLANDILDFTKIRSNEFKLECIPYDVGSLTEQVIDLISIEAFNRGLEIITDIDYSIPSEVMGDPTRVQQIILNLVKNAVKFTAKGYVLVRLTRQKNKMLFEIIDSGIGITEEKQKMIFTDFYQVDASTTRKYGGTGLGLSICKNLVSVMKGQIGVRSNPHGGSIFWFALPLEPAVSISDDVKQKLVVPKNTRILVVDDNTLAVQTLVKKLRAVGITDIETASTGEKALAMLIKAAKSGTPFTIALIDMIMPVMDGWRLAAEINTNTVINNLRLYLVVPEGQMGGEAKMKMLDWFNGYLYKPVKHAQLVDTLQEAFTQPFDLEPFEGEAAAGKTMNTPASITPANKTSANNTITKSDDSHIASGKKLLVAEDHPVNRKLMQTFLEKYGATVFLAEDGEQAVTQIAQHPEIDMIFMDIQMPIKNGVDATIELRHKGYKGIIVACTANNNPDEFQEYREMGINDILVKPFKRDTVKQIIEKWNTVLSFPEAKKIVTLTDMNNSASSIWDINDFMDTTGNDKQLASSLMDDYITQSHTILTQIKAELAKQDKDFDLLHRLGHTLKGSSAAISAFKLSEYGKKMDEAAKTKNAIALEASRTDFAIDFIKLEQIVKDWKQSL